MRRIPLLLTCLAMVTGGWCSVASAQQEPTSTPSANEVRASLRADQTIVQAGRPVWIEFTLTNLTDRPITLQPSMVPEQPAQGGEMGLPLGHVFSGKGFSALTIVDGQSELFDSQVAVRPQGGVRPVTLAPRGSAGIRIDAAQHYEVLHRPGNYRITWSPYLGTLQSQPLELTVLAEKQAIMHVGDFGKLTLRFYYNEAPNHVQNFIELVEKKFYEGTTIHRVIPGGIIQGGDPRGDGRGLRPDGKRLKAEFNNIPFEMGTVGMARSPKDPDSASCQFFICLGRQPSFDHEQTAFAYVVGEESFETLRRIQAVPTGEKDRPIKPIYIRAVSLETIYTRDNMDGSPANPADPKASPATAGGRERTGTANKPTLNASSIAVYPDPPATQPVVSSK